jgi:hypothetical protein
MELSEIIINKVDKGKKKIANVTAVYIDNLYTLFYFIHI